jgi:hypothetical protein
VEEGNADRRESVRDEVFLGGVAEISGQGSTMDCVVRNFSENGACVEFDSSARIPDEMNLTIATGPLLPRPHDLAAGQPCRPCPPCHGLGQARERP